MKSKNPKERVSVFLPEFMEDLSFWIKTDRRTALKIFDIVEEIMRNPFEGMGKPGPLRYLGSGVWSRRITQEHRLIYVIEDDKNDFIQCRYHY